MYATVGLLFNSEITVRLKMLFKPPQDIQLLHRVLKKNQTNNLTDKLKKKIKASKILN